ncbi:hypothetical protein SUDANB54_04101 [Streptomyces sp. enrichment culture]
MNTGYHCGMPEIKTAEVGVRELRQDLSDFLNKTAIHGQITYVTSHGRRIAAIVPLQDGEAIEAARRGRPGEESADS